MDRRQVVSVAGTRQRRRLSQPVERSLSGRRRSSVFWISLAVTYAWSRVLDVGSGRDDLIDPVWEDIIGKDDVHPHMPPAAAAISGPKAAAGCRAPAGRFPSANLATTAVTASAV